jgi:uncharacterized protein YbjT (DUF2867 family)
MMRCLVLGATGYVGSRLVPRLLAAGHEVRCLVRSAEKMRATVTDDEVEILVGDVLDCASVRRAVAGVDVVYYLVHSLNRPDFPAQDRHAAAILAEAAAAARVGQLVYLGGLQPDAAGAAISRHLASRAEVGRIFLDSPVPTLVLQASMIIGSGSTSYELLRYAAERIPVLPLPAWADHRTQPIAIDDVLYYLTACPTVAPPLNCALDIGGPEILTYGELIQRYARITGLPKRLFLPAPWWSAALIAWFVEMLTPVSAAIARPLLESLEHALVCRDHKIADHIPDPPEGLISVDQAIQRAAACGPLGVAQIARHDAAEHTAAFAQAGDPPGAGGPLYVDQQVLTSSARPGQIWRVLAGIGGDNGWYTLPMLWTARGLLDHLLGGIGLHRGRPARLHPGDAVDWWRVEDYDPGRMRLLLRAEMKMPGTTWLEMVVEPADNQSADYRQCIYFVPSGITGHVYWWVVKPLHKLVFDLMARNIVRAAETTAEQHSSGHRAPEPASSKSWLPVPSPLRAFFVLPSPVGAATYVMGLDLRHWSRSLGDRIPIRSCLGA